MLKKAYLSETPCINKITYFNYNHLLNVNMYILCVKTVIPEAKIAP